MPSQLQTFWKKWFSDSHKRASQLRLHHEMQEMYVDLTSAADSVIIPDEAALLVSTLTSEDEATNVSPLGSFRCTLLQ